MGVLQKTVSIFGWLFVACTTLFFLGVVLMIVSISATALGGTDLIDLAIKTDKAVAVVDLSGEILKSSSFNERLRKLLENEKVKAIVVQIDSPGGAVGASEELYRAIKAGNLKKPVTCALSNVAASGGIYAALGCRKIVANAGTLTGSIGVLMMIPNISSITSKYGFQMTVIKSGQFKDSGSPFRQFETAEKDLFQQLVNQTYEQFIKTVSEARGIEIDEVRKFADGRIILGEEAVRLGLVDEIGGVERAAKLALESASIEGDPEIIYPSRPTGLMALMGDVSESRVVSWIKNFGEFQLLYRLAD